MDLENVQNKVSEMVSSKLSFIGGLKEEKKKSFFSSLKRKPLVEKCLKILAVAAVTLSIYITAPTKTDAYISDRLLEFTKTSTTNLANDQCQKSCLKLSTVGAPLLKIDVGPEYVVGTKYDTANLFIAGNELEFGAWSPKDRPRIGGIPLYWGGDLCWMRELNKKNYEEIFDCNAVIGSGIFYDLFRNNMNKLSLRVNGDFVLIGSRRRFIYGDSLSDNQLIYESIHKTNLSLEVTYALFGREVPDPGYWYRFTTNFYWVGISPFIHYSEESIGNKHTISTRYGLEFNMAVFSIKLEKCSNGEDRASVSLFVGVDDPTQ